ncbi:MAG: proton-conducting membrane transporter [Lachnospiraceae bacterium]|nr:proton-conducting membrane transporter [Lachnospiraceae bacterium]
MSSFFLLIAVLLPILSGLAIPAAGLRDVKKRNRFIETMVIITSVIVLALLFNTPQDHFVFARFTRHLSLSLRIDGLSRVFAGLISFMWPFASLYAFEYMEDSASHAMPDLGPGTEGLQSYSKKDNTDSFFMFYTMTYGVALGIAFAEDIFTMYFFYELLTLVTVPLVLHTLTREAILAGRTYLYYSLGGAGFAFIGLVFIITYSSNINFRYGGVLSILRLEGNENVLLLIYVLAFMGFGVKAAVFPLGAWLPKASVAPTPVTALLHAVAVVNAGAFAIIRLTYYSFGTEFLKGSWAQKAVMAISLITILYSSSMALKETHIKRRLAYSTSSNLSYIIFGVTLMTPAGLLGALMHFVIHAFMKIGSFLCAGAIMHVTEKNYIHELNGLAKRMPKVFVIFTVCALSLMGVPGFGGFASKWYLAAAAVEEGGAGPYTGICVLLISALLTAIYMMTMIIRGYYPEIKTEEEKGDPEESFWHDPGFRMLLPLTVFAVVTIALGLFSNVLADFLRGIME